MKPDSLLNEDWSRVVTRLGGAASLDQTARATIAFLRPREIRCAADRLRLILAYCLGERGFGAGAGRLIRLIDATCVLKPGPEARQRNRLWRVHAAFDLPTERFSCFELTDEHGGEQRDRIPVVKGEIRIGDRVYMQPVRIANVLGGGADVVIRARWRSVR